MRERCWAIGRSEEIDQVVQAVRKRSTPLAVITGRPGVGRSRALEESLRFLASEGHPTLHICGTSTLTQVPFGPLLREFPPGIEENSVPVILQKMRRHFGTSGLTGRHLVLAVDDAHLLDAESVALLTLLAAEGKTGIALTMPSTCDQEELLAPLWKDYGAHWVELHPLAAGATAEMAHALLEGPVDGALAMELHRLSGGLPLWLRELLRSAHDENALTRADGGLWHLATPRLPLSTRLLKLARMRLPHCPPRARQAAELVALADNHLMLSWLQALVDTEDIAHAEAAGLLRISGSEEPVVTLHDPVMGMLLRHDLPLVAAREAYGRLADAATSTGLLAEPDLLRAARWQQEAGGKRPLDMLVGAAAAAARSGRHHLALDLAHEAGVDAADASSELLHLATAAAFWSGDPQRAKDYALRLQQADQGDVEAPAPQPPTPAPLTDASLAISASARAENALVDLTQHAGPTSPLGESAVALRALSHLETGDVSLALHLMKQHGEDERQQGETLVGARIAALCAAGRPLDALALDERTPRRDADFDRYRIGLDTSSLALALCYAGDRERAVELARTGYARAADDGADLSRAVWAHTEGHLSLVLGDHENAVHSLLEAFELPRRLGTAFCPEIVAGCLGRLARAQLGAGDAEGAARTLARPEASWPTSPVASVEIARAWLSAVEGEHQAAQERLWRTAAFNRAAGALLLSATALLELARMGVASQVAAPLAEISRLAQGPVIRAWSCTAASLADPDSEQRSSCAVELNRLGFHRLAADIEETAHTLDQATPDAELPAKERACRAAQLLQRLTQREWEIGRLVSEGFSSAAVAARLHLSRRTVESHLQRAYHKLGVHSRRELAVLITGDYAPAS
ncbi:LuxR C-terminal-related transcriptional regulator [Streptomyces sp. NPDC090442]|uniref:LuxR C-terminal-related transcriptional regulator n=1 Tax=Streptomyces sp. NPDC090442 TaxID=3365962 RepID=UPI00381A6CB9